MTPKEKIFESYLKAEGFKLTAERRSILEEICESDEHFEASDLWVRLRQRGVRVSKATIYRTLPLLVKSGLLRDSVSIEKRSYYESMYGREHHEHMVCIKCGRIKEFSSPVIEKLQDKICAAHKFKAISHRLMVMGYCHNCQKLVI